MKANTKNIIVSHILANPEKNKKEFKYMRNEI